MEIRKLDRVLGFDVGIVEVDDPTTGGALVGKVKPDWWSDLPDDLAVGIDGIAADH